MINTVQGKIELAKEGMEISAQYLLLRLGLKRMTIEERYLLKMRIARYNLLMQEMGK